MGTHTANLPPPAGGGTNASADAEQQQPLLHKAQAQLQPEASAHSQAHPKQLSAAQRWLLPAAYGLTNLASVVVIVMANKVVLYTCKFSFPVTLSCTHTIFTWAGMSAMATCGVFERARLPLARVLPLAAAYVAFIAFNNISIQVNTVGFYQLSKIAITPVVVLIEYFTLGKHPTPRLLVALVALCMGVALATVTDSQVSSNLVGVCIATVCVLAGALYQVWAGSKQKELGLSANQLVHAVTLPAVGMMALLIPLLEPVGLGDPKPGTILGYNYSAKSVAWILLSSVLGLVVTLSAFLFIGATSSLTYNVVGHVKTAAILAGGVIFFGDEMNARKAAGLVLTMTGIIYYSRLSLTGAAIVRKHPAPSSGGGGGGGGAGKGGQ